MRHLPLIFTSFLFILFSCQEQQQEETSTSEATIHGQILNPKDEFIEIQGASDKMDTIWLSDEGMFSEVIPLDSAQKFTFLHGGEYARLYLTPGDSLEINLNTEQFDESLEFSGRGEIPNRYLLESLIARGEWEQKYPYRDLHELDPEVFLQVVDSMYQEQEVLLSNLKKALPDNTFVEREGTSIAYQKALQLYNYEKTRMRFLGVDTVALPENYYDFVGDLDLNNPKNLGIPAYEQFLYVYLDDETRQYLERNSDTSPNAQLRGKLQTIDENITDSSIKEELYAEAIKQQINYHGTEGIEELMPKVKENIDDSTKLASINNLLAQWRELERGKSAPEISGTTIDGEEVSLSDLSGNLVYVDVWATWCAPCLKEIPYLDELQQKFEGKSVKFVSISIDEDKTAWEEMVKEENLGGIQLHASGDKKPQIAEDYLIRAIPRFMLIDENGDIISVRAPRPSGNAAEMIRENLPSTSTAMNRK